MPGQCKVTIYNIMLIISCLLLSYLFCFSHLLQNVNHFFQTQCLAVCGYWNQVLRAVPALCTITEPGNLVLRSQQSFTDRPLGHCSLLKYWHADSWEK